MQATMEYRELGVVTPEEAHLIARLERLLAARGRTRKHGRSGPPDASVVQENRRMIRDCINKLRLLRAGVPSPFLGLGQRESRRHS